ncbi:potassium channel family protein [Streptococcus loxodontisalivarius]|uniref:Trk system potassium uptake protein TrkA n=1 Tax=Streptococcus loxodontisalivarius TaxID=1349415 RepID=A0ABS2PU86_9STRE|nr:TrkA family potassium uptake protein [Streptococcus loxodontisalivarius]MBM7643614.1 trk system potassium uptake protein TrkA [Streptococcus loxodontisalivarius]
MSTKIIGVLGLGIFGQTVARELSTFDQDVIALDNSEQHVQEIADVVTKAAIGDITDIDFLRAAGIDQCDTVIIATGEHLEASTLALIHCKKLGVPNIIAKAKNINYEEVLYGIGADLVIMPERNTGKTVASDLLRHKISNVFHIEDDISIVEFDLPKDWIGKSLIDLNVRQKYDLNIIGIRDNRTAPLNTKVDPNLVFQEGISISAIADSRTFEKFDYLGYLK